MEARGRTALEAGILSGWAGPEPSPSAPWRGVARGMRGSSLKWLKWSGRATYIHRGCSEHDGPAKVGAGGTVNGWLLNALSGGGL